MGCFDPFERDLVMASNARVELAAEVKRLQQQLRESLGLLSARTTQDPARWEGRVAALRERTLPILARAYHGRFQWSDIPPMPGTEDAAGGPFPDFGAVHDLLGEAEETRLTLERLLCEVRSELLTGPGSARATEDNAAERALYVAHRHDDRAEWLRHARRHLEFLELTVRTASDAGRPAAKRARARWRQTIARVEAMDDTRLLDRAALPPIPGVGAR